MNKLFLIFLLSLIVLPLVASADLTFPIHTNYDLNRPCINNGTYCDATYDCNITFVYPDGSVLLDNVLMTNNGAFHTASVSQAQNNRFGVYSATMMCTDGSLSGTDTFTVEITGDGNSSSPFPIQFSILIFGFALIIAGKWREDVRLIKYVGSMLLMTIGVITLYPGWSIFNFSSLPGLSLGIISIGVGGYFLIEDSLSRFTQSENYQGQYYEDDGRYHG